MIRVFREKAYYDKLTAKPKPRAWVQAMQAYQMGLVSEEQARAAGKSVFVIDELMDELVKKNS